MKNLLLALLMFVCTTSYSQQVYPLYEGEIPNSIPTPDKESSAMRDSILIVSNVSRPTLTVYLPPPDKATGDAIVVCPGGGYSILAAGHEGVDVAKKLNELGIAAFVLKYRIPNRETMPKPEIGPLQDAQRAIQMVRQNARKWNINKNSVGILGFSAGGHLAATAATHYNKPYIRVRKRESLRPDFAVLIYPVITFTHSFGHTGSRDNMLGKDATAEQVREYSNELHVTPKTPPTFLVHAKNDPVSYKNTLLFADSLNAKGVFSEVLLFEEGGHGFGLVNKTSDIQWVERMSLWLKKLKD